jgi:hypothetical protein
MISIENPVLRDPQRTLNMSWSVSPIFTSGTPGGTDIVQFSAGDVGLNLYEMSVKFKRTPQQRNE